MYLIVNLVDDGWCGIAAKRVRHLSIWYEYLIVNLVEKLPPLAVKLVF